MFTQNVFLQTINIQSLQELPSLYTVLSDISSFLPIAACALRLPIYTINDRQIRVEVLKSNQVVQKIKLKIIFPGSKKVLLSHNEMLHMLSRSSLRYSSKKETS